MTGQPDRVNVKYSPTRASSHVLFKTCGAHLLRSWLNAGASMNIKSIIHAELTFQPEMSWLNTVAFANMDPKEAPLAVFHFDKS
jgi:hypothetical protein